MPEHELVYQSLEVRRHLHRRRESHVTKLGGTRTKFGCRSIATAGVAAVADGRTFRNGRQFAAWLGLAPRRYASGDKLRMLGITKRADPYLRMLLIHGAPSVL
jgi:transposase